MSKRNNGKKLITDKKTDYLFEYFVNEDKFNDQMKGEWNDEMEKKINQELPKLDSRIATEKIPHYSESSEEKELPSSSNKSDRSRDMNVDFNDDDSVKDDRSDSQCSYRSPYGQRINAAPYPGHQDPPYQANVGGPRYNYEPEQEGPRYVETAEERRARARENYTKLMDLKEKYNIKLTKEFTPNDDPDEMEDEYNMHRDRRNKNNQVKFYKQILLNVVSGAEFLNDRYNPFEFKLKDWSKQVATDLDDYTEVLEEIYEKYKHVGGKMAPEIRLLFMIIMSGVSYHISQALFGGDGLNTTIQNNPNIVNKLLGGLMKGGISNMEPPVESGPDNKNILEMIKKHNQNKSQKSESTSTTADSETESKMALAQEKLALEREKRLLAEKKADIEAQARRQNDILNAQLEQMRNQQVNMLQSQILSAQQPVPDIIESGINQILSDGRSKPRFQDNKRLNVTDEKDSIFGSELNDATNIPIKIKNSSTKKPKKSFDEIIESLEESTDVDLDEIINSSKKKKVTSIKKPKTNSITRSSAKNNGMSDTSSTRKKEVIRL